MFNELKKINTRPELYGFYTAEILWNDEHISKQMLDLHLNEHVDISSRNKVFIDKSADWIASRFNIGKDTQIADFGCGPGLYTARFAENGAAVTGIDFSERSIRYAKKTATQKGLNIDYVLQNYLEFSTDKKFDLITMIYCDFCALSPKQRRNLIGTFYKHLNDNGSVLLDVFSLNAFHQRKEVATYERFLLNGFWSAEDYYGFLNTFKYEDEKVIVDKYTIIQPSRTWEVYNWLQYFSTESVSKEFENNGFRVEAYYSDVAGTPYSEDSPEIAIVAKIRG